MACEPTEISGRTPQPAVSASNELPRGSVAAAPGRAAAVGVRVRL